MDKSTMARSFDFKTDFLQSRSRGRRAPSLDGAPGVSFIAENGFCVEKTGKMSGRHYIFTRGRKEFPLKSETAC